MSSFESSSETIRRAIASASGEPKEVEGDMGKIVNHSLSELIAADKYIRGVEATTDQTVTSRRNRIKALFMRIAPPGSRGGR